MTNLVSNNLPDTSRNSRDSRSRGRLSSARRRRDSAKLTQPGDTDLATRRAVGEKVPETSSIGSSFVAAPLREGREAIVEREAGSSSFLAADVPGVGGIDRGSSGRASAALNVELDDTCSLRRQVSFCLSPKSSY